MVIYVSVGVDEPTTKDYFEQLRKAVEIAESGQVSVDKAWLYRQAAEASFELRTDINEFSDNRSVIDEARVLKARLDLLERVGELTGGGFQAAIEVNIKTIIDCAQERLCALPVDLSPQYDRYLPEPRRGGFFSRLASYLR